MDFGILVDGAVVMVENIFRQIAARQGAPLDVLRRSSKMPRRKWTVRWCMRSR